MTTPLRPQLLRLKKQKLIAKERDEHVLTERGAKAMKKAMELGDS